MSIPKVARIQTFTRDPASIVHTMHKMHLSLHISNMLETEIGNKNFEGGLGQELTKVS